MDGAGPELEVRCPARSPLLPTRSGLEDGVRNLPVRSVLEDAASPPLSSPPPVFFLACAFDA
eukprot:gene10094-biopygen2876